jgi:HAD superfamily hydrolase (TIGR01450 family)
MKAVILAAGLGSRLHTITSKKPKCMVNVCGIPIIKYQIDAYLSAGIDDIIVVVGYKSEVVKEYIKKLNNNKLHVIENVDYDTTNNMYSLYLAMSVFKLYNTDFIISNGDVVFDSLIIKELLNKESKDLIVCDKNSYNLESMKVTTNIKGFITDISKSISRDVAYGNSIDVYKISKTTSLKLFSYLKEYIEYNKNLKEWTEVALQKMIKSGDWQVVPFDIKGKKWMEIDNIDDLLEAEKKFSKIYTLKDKEVFFLDLDGTIYLGNKLIDGAINFIEELNKKGKLYFFISNNSSHSKEDYVKKLRNYNINITKEKIILSTDGLINFLKEYRIKNVFTVGTKSLKREIEKNGINPDSKKPELIVLGYDTELTYKKLADAVCFVNKGCDYIATHCDILCPTENGPIPDIGILIEIFKLSTLKKPFKIFGKPNKEMIDFKIKELKVSTNKIVIIGDRLYTDGMLSKNIGTTYILPLSGETNREMIEDSDIEPALVIRSIGDLIKYL